MIIRSEYFHKHGLKIRDKIVIASKEVLRDNKTVYPFVDDEMLKYADQVHILKTGYGVQPFSEI